MVKKRVLSPLPILEGPLLEEALQEGGFKPQHLTAIWRECLAVANKDREQSGGQGVGELYLNLDGLKDMPKKLWPYLKDKFALFTSRVTETQRSQDGTIKLLVRLQDEKEVEAVIIPHRKGEKGEKDGRRTLCVSSQVGCQMACNFCATGTLGLQGNLWTGEILEQVLHATRLVPIRNVVFMGEGEPLQNYEAVLQAIRSMWDPRLFGLRRTHVTLSTVGVVPQMRRLTRDAPNVQLALSLHAPNQKLRNYIVPSAQAFPLDKLMQALKDHMNAKSTRASQGALIEYVLLADVNDTDECAHELAALMQGCENEKLKVNLIPYNETFVPDSPFREPSQEQVQNFRAILASYGLFVTVRNHHGRDIDGACGQLALQSKNEAGAVTDIEDLGNGCGGGAGSRGGSAKAALTGRKRLANGASDGKREGGDLGWKRREALLLGVLVVGAVVSAVMVFAGTHMRRRGR
ncbi:unnamed protein product [Chrysoparadoxa australica]